MYKQYLFILTLSSFYTAHAAWYDAPVSWFNQSMSWLRQNTYDAYQKTLTWAGYQAYQAPKAPTPAPINVKKHPTLLVRNELSTYITPQLEAALTAYENMADLEKKWADEERKNKYPWQTQQRHMQQYPTIRAQLLKKDPILAHLEIYKPLIAALNQMPAEEINTLEYFPNLAPTMTKIQNLPPQERATIYAILNDLLIWIARMADYFNDPWASKFSLSYIHEEIKAAGNRFVSEIGGIYSPKVLHQLVGNNS